MMDIPDAAKLWKQALRAKWPEVRWSVRSAPRGWACVVTAWQDGPTFNTVATFCYQWRKANPDAAHWLLPSGLQRTYSPAGYAVVIDSIARDIPDMSIPRTPDGGLDQRAARAGTWDGPVRVGSQWYGHEHTYDLVAIVEFVAASHDYTTPPAATPTAPDQHTPR